MKRLIFKPVAIILIIAHLSLVSLQNLSFASEKTLSRKPAPKVTKEELIGYKTARGERASSADSFSPEKAIKNFYLDPFTGTLSLSLPIFTPPGRKGVQPILNLTYSSRNANGPFGWGWRMDLGYIERSTKDGIPKYDSTDKFIYSLNGANGELITIGEQEYRSRDESNFLNFKFDTSSYSWIAKDKQGNTYFFGRDKYTRAYKTDDVVDRTGEPFRWYLDGIKDINGNGVFFSSGVLGSIMPLPYKMVYTYYQPNNNEYLPWYYDIDTNKKGIIEITFEPGMGQREDQAWSYRSGAPEVEQEGYSAVGEITVNYYPLNSDNTEPILIRKYVFEYKYSQMTKHLLLSKITELGADGASIMPPISFTYQDMNTPTYQILSMSGDPAQGDNLWNIRVDDNVYEIYRLTYNNNYELYPHWSVYNWGQIYSQPSGSDLGLSWNINVNGDLSVNSPSWRVFYAWTYAYMQNARNLNISCGGNSNHTIYLNADYTNSYRNTNISLPLKAGYNLIEVTGYNENDFSFNLTADLVGSVDLMNSKQVIIPSLSGDFNGDGLDDLGTFFASTGTCKIALSNGASFLPKETWIDNFGVNQRLLLGDFNGDGKTDICAFDSSSGNWRIALSDGAKFIDDGIWISDFGKDSEALSADFNGDSKADLCIIYPSALWDGTEYRDTQIAFNKNGSFEKQESFRFGYPEDIPLISDRNGDGMAELVRFIPEEGDWTFWFYSIDGFTFEHIPDSFGANKKPFALDFNGDSFSDVAYYDDATGKFLVKLNRFKNFNDIETIEWPFVFTFKDYQIQSGDYNGDRIQDFCAYNSLGNIEVAFSAGDIPDLLSKVENGTGGTLGLKYSPYSKFNDIEGNLPFVLPVLSKSIVSDGQGNSYETNYSYSGGSYDTEDKEFRGFAYARAVDIEGNSTESYFKQGDIYKGKLYKQEIRDKDCRLFSKVENTWQHTEPYPGVYFPYLAQTDNYIYDGDDTYKQTRTKFEYDSYGNTTKVISEGDVDVSGDEQTQSTEYAYNIADWLLAFPKHAYLSDANQNKISEKWLYYDDHTDINDQPLNGLLTKQEVWLYNPLTQAENRISTTYNYDEYGNLTSATDPLGRSTTTVYDPDLHTYPAATTNALGHTIKTTYDLGIGKPLIIIDPNNQTTANVYDSLGRLIKIRGPNDTEDYPGVIYEYDLSTYPVKTIKKVKTNYAAIPAYLTYYSFYDGLSRLIQTKSPAENNPQGGQARQVISEISKFDQRGQVKEKYLPYFLEASADYVAPSYDTPHTAFTYDPIGRLIQTTNPDLTYSSVTYSDWMKTITDENGHYKTEYCDAYGRILKIEEHNGSQTYTTTYEYSPLGNLVKLTDNQGNTTQIWYDSLGRKLKMSDPDMGVWAYEYDAVGNLRKQTDAKGQVLEFEYDGINRLKRKACNARPIAQYSYDTGSYGKGRLCKVTDTSGATEFFYDKLGREIKSIKTVKALGAFTVKRSYNALDRLTSLTYPDETILKYTYNNAGSLEKIYIADVGGETIYYLKNIDYSPTGQITKIKYGNGSETDYTYDPNTLRLTNLTTQSLTGKIQNLNYQFDKVGNIKDITDYVNTATQSFLYDDLNRLIQAQGNYGSFTYGYDSIGNMIYKEGARLSYGKNGKPPHAVTQYGSTSIDYDANGNMLKKGNLELTYDTDNKLSKVINKAPTAKVNIALSPGWNFISFPVILSDTKISSVLSSIAGKYDQVFRFNPGAKKFQYYVGDAQYDQFSDFEYGKGYEIYITAAENVTLTVSGALPIATKSISLKSGYNLIFCPKTSETAVEAALSSLQLGIDYSRILYYDKVANKFLEYSAAKKEFTKLKQGISYFLYCLKDVTWKIPNPPPTTAFTYDGDGGRVTKTLPSGTSTTYIGSLFEIDSKTGKTTKYIFAGPKRICTVESTGNQYYYHQDHLGSSNIITDQNGAQAGLTEFRPYGTVSKSSGAYNPKFKFTGKELDNTGFYFYGARYYDAQLGRFITPDTIIQAPYDPQSLNRYSYCRNNPLIYTDPTGHSFWGAVGGFFRAIGSFFGGMFSAIGGFFSGFFGGAFGRGGGGSGGSSGSSAPVLPGSSREGSGPSSSGVSQSFISGAWNFGSSIGSALGGAFKAATLNIGGGIRDWLSEPRAGWYNAAGKSVNPADIEPGSTIFTNGAHSELRSSLMDAVLRGANYIFYNPTSTFLADFIEVFLQKFTFTSSIDRQMASGLSQVTGPINIIAHSQGTLTASNALISSGLQGFHSVTGVSYVAPVISQAREIVSSWVSGARTLYGTNTFDPSNVAGPNLNPVEFFGGIVGGILFQGKYHSLDKHED
jgi:RHS repeat-associated protein